MSITWAALALAASLPGAVEAAPRPLPAQRFPQATPSQLTNSLYTELSGFLDRPRLDPQPIVSPLWWQFLSRRTGALFAELNRLDAEDGMQTISQDWLCQCRYRRRFKVPPQILAERSTKDSAELTVRLHGYGGSRQLSLHYVWEDGWKIDDIVTSDSARFSEALRRGIRNHARGRKALLDNERP